MRFNMGYSGRHLAGHAIYYDSKVYSVACGTCSSCAVI